MHRVKTSYRHRILSFPKMFLPNFLVFSLLISANIAIAQSSSHNGGQWSSVGGKMVASGEGHFSNKWSRATRYFHGDGKYWKNDEPTSNKTTGKIPATHTQEEVNQDVWKRQGQITVRGPGYLGLFMRSKGAGAVLKFPQSGKVFHSQGLGKDEWLHDAQNNWKWYPGEVVNIDPNQQLGGWVPAGRTMTLDVWVYNPFSDWGIWGSGYSAPKSVEYEFWFFPRKGGKVIKVAETPGKSVMDNIDTPPLGKIADVVTTGTSLDDPITGTQGEVKESDSEDVLYVYEYDIYGGVGFDFGGDVGVVPFDKLTGSKRVNKDGYIIVRPGDTIVTGDNPGVVLRHPYRKGEIRIGSNSRVTFTRVSEYNRVFQNAKKIQKRIGTFKENSIVTWLRFGSAILKIHRFFLMGDEDLKRLYPLGGPGGGVRGTVYKLAHDKSSGESSVTVAEGEVIAACNMQSAPVLSIKAGEKITWKIDCQWQKTKLATSEIQQITSLFPDVKKATRLVPIADSIVYAYSYRNWNKANWGKYGSLGAGWHPTGGEKRTYLKFNLSGIDPKSVGKTTLKLFHYHTGGNNSLSLGIYEVTSPWQEGGGTYHSGQTEKSAAPGEISWVNQPTFDLSPVAGFKPGSKTGQYIDVDITPLVKAWLSGKPNYGLVIKPVGIMSGRAPESSYGFYSREYQDRSKLPILVLSPVSQSQGTARLLTVSSDRDMVGRNETFRGNGKKDAIFQARFSAPNRTVTAVEVSNTNGLRSVWDTRPNNRLWLGGVVVGGRTMNRPDGSVNFRLGSGQNTLDFFVEDNGSIRGGKTNYRMTIFFASGDPLIMDVAPGPVGQSGGGAPTEPVVTPGKQPSQTGSGATGSVTGGGGAGGNLLTNPSFEQGKSAGSSYVIIKPGSTDLPGWQITGDSVDVVGSAWKSSHGLRAVDIHGYRPGGVRQSFPTTPGKVYRVSFDLAGNPWAGPQVKTLHVDIPGIVQKAYQFDIKGKNPRNMGWTRHSFTFQATQPISTLHFFSTGPAGNGAGPAIDNVVVMPASSGPVGQPGGIKIESASYGANCGVAKGNVTAHIAKQCDGKSRCRYVVNHKIIGDPAYGCAKTYTVRYRCGNNPRVFDRSLSAEAGWGDKAVLLECPGSQD